MKSGKILDLAESIKHHRGVVVVGPRCSGKTTIIRQLGTLLSEVSPKIEMKFSMLNTDVYSLDQLYGSANSGLTNPEMSSNKNIKAKIASVTPSVLQMALKGFETCITDNKDNLETFNDDTSSHAEENKESNEYE